MKNRVLYKYKHKLPDYSKPLSAGIDLRADIDEIIVLEPPGRAII